MAFASRFSRLMPAWTASSSNCPALRHCVLISAHICHIRSSCGNFRTRKQTKFLLIWSNLYYKTCTIPYQCSGRWFPAALHIKERRAYAASLRFNDSHPEPIRRFISDVVREASCDTKHLKSEDPNTGRNIYIYIKGLRALCNYLLSCSIVESIV